MTSMKSTDMCDTKDDLWEGKLSKVGRLVFQLSVNSTDMNFSKSGAYVENKQYGKF